MIIGDFLQITADRVKYFSDCSFDIAAVFVDSDVCVFFIQYRSFIIELSERLAFTYHDSPAADISESVSEFAVIEAEIDDNAYFPEMFHSPAAVDDASAGCDNAVSG